MLLMSKGSKVVFVVFMQHCIWRNVTHLTHVKRVESVICIKWPLTPPKYSVRTPNIFTHNFLNIQLIFNLKKVLERVLPQCMLGLDTPPGISLDTPLARPPILPPRCVPRQPQARPPNLPPWVWA